MRDRRAGAVDDHAGRDEHADLEDQRTGEAGAGSVQRRHRHRKRPLRISTAGPSHRYRRSCFRPRSPNHVCVRLRSSQHARDRRATARRRARARPAGRPQWRRRSSVRRPRPTGSVRAVNGRTRHHRRGSCGEASSAVSPRRSDEVGSRSTSVMGGLYPAQAPHHALLRSCPCLALRLRRGRDAGVRAQRASRARCGPRRSRPSTGSRARR